VPRVCAYPSHSPDHCTRFISRTSRSSTQTKFQFNSNVSNWSSHLRKNEFNSKNYSIRFEISNNSPLFDSIRNEKTLFAQHYRWQTGDTYTYTAQHIPDSDTTYVCRVYLPNNVNFNVLLQCMAYVKSELSKIVTRSPSVQHSQLPFHNANPLSDLAYNRVVPKVMQQCTMVNTRKPS